MPKARDYQVVGADYATTGPNTTTLRQPVPKSAETLFRCLEDGPAWKEWLGIDVEWTSPRPFGVGTTRTIVANGQKIDEVFTAWESGRRMAFYFAKGSLPLKAFAEDYVVESTGENSAELVWSYAYEWGLPVGSRLFGWIFKRNSKRTLPKLAELLESTDRFDQPAA